MKSIGVVRRLDQLGRVVIPKGIRAARGWNAGDQVEIFVKGDQIILRGHKPGCQICTGAEEVAELEGGIRICVECASKVYEHRHQLLAPE